MSLKITNIPLLKENWKITYFFPVEICQFETGMLLLINLS